MKSEAVAVVATEVKLADEPAAGEGDEPSMEPSMQRMEVVAEGTVVVAGEEKAVKAPLAKFWIQEEDAKVAVAENGLEGAQRVGATDEADSAGKEEEAAEKGWAVTKGDELAPPPPRPPSVMAPEKACESAAEGETGAVLDTAATAADSDELDGGPGVATGSIPLTLLITDLVSPQTLGMDRFSTEAEEGQKAQTAEGGREEGAVLEDRLSLGGDEGGGDEGADGRHRLLGSSAPASSTTDAGGMGPESMANLTAAVGSKRPHPDI